MYDHPKTGISGAVYLVLLGIFALFCAGKKLIEQGKKMLAK